MSKLKNIRFNTDASMELSLTIDGVKIDFSNMSGIKVLMYSERQRVVTGACLWQAWGTSLKVKAPALLQKYAGPHRVIMTCVLDGAKATYDALAYNVVATSEEIDAQGLTAQEEISPIGIDLQVTDVTDSLIRDLIHAAIVATERAEAAADNVPPLKSGTGEDSVQQVTHAEAPGDYSCALNGAKSFLYHEGENDERTIQTPNPTTASGLASHAEGIGAIASGPGAHAEGHVAVTDDFYDEETGEYSQTVIPTEASGRGSHAEGLGTKSRGSGTHSEGIGTDAGGNSSHTEGYYTKAHTGEGTHTEGMQTDASGNGAHAEGYHTLARGTAAHAEGRGGVATEYGAHVEGGYLKDADTRLDLAYSTKQSSDGEHWYEVRSPKKPAIIEGLGCSLRDGTCIYIAEYAADKAIVRLTAEVPNGVYIFSNVAKATSSHAEGGWTVAEGEGSHAEGVKTRALARASHAEGVLTVASGAYAHAENEETLAQGDSSHAEGYLTFAGANQAHAEGNETKATARDSHAEGKKTEANGEQSHAEGYASVADGEVAHAEGDTTHAEAYASHTEGIGTEARNDAEHAQGRYNKSHTNTIHSVGIGASKQRKNAHAILRDGRHFILGIGNYDGTELEGCEDLALVLQNIIKYVEDSAPIQIDQAGLNVLVEFTNEGRSITLQDLEDYMELTREAVLRACTGRAHTICTRTETFSILGSQYYDDNRFTLYFGQIMGDDAITHYSIYCYDGEISVTFSEK